MWSMTPGEFFDVMIGCMERSRDEALMMAFAATAFGGDAFALIGEERPLEDNPDKAWAEGSPEATLAARQEAMREINAAREADRAELHRQYIPAALRSDVHRG